MTRLSQRAPLEVSLQIVLSQSFITVHYLNHVAAAGAASAASSRLASVGAGFRHS